MEDLIKPLQFNSKGKFRIMVVGDIHEKYAADKKTEDFLRLLNRAIKELRPHLTILMGDIVSSRYVNKRGKVQNLSVDQLREEIKRIITPFALRDIPLVLVFGNHDGEKGEPKEVLLELFQEYPNFRTIHGEDITGCGNCNLLIKDSKGEKDIFNIWLMDSGNRPSEGKGEFAYVESDQISWYERVSDELKEQNGGEPIPALHFQHIPVIEEYRLLKRTGRYNPRSVRGNSREHSNQFFVIADRKKTTGYLGEGPSTPDSDNGQFSSWKKQGDVIGAFFGHDHMNDFCGEVDGIMLGQSKCAGFHIYGDGLHQGVRLITLNENDPRKLETKMHYYRDYFGIKNNSIKGFDLFTERFRKNARTVIGIVSYSIIVAAIIAFIKYIIG